MIPALILIILLLAPHRADALVLAYQAGNILHVTVVSESGLPVTNTLVAFVLEGESETRGACRTNQIGQCSLTVGAAPRGASGLLRGTLHLSAGKRPVIWPGGELAITIETTNSGLIRSPADFISGPDRVLTTPTVTPAIVPTLLITPEPTMATEMTIPNIEIITPTSTATVTPAGTVTPSAATATLPQSIVPVSDTPAGTAWLYLLILVGVLATLVVFMVRRIRRQGRQRA